jgi:hypothetical protein
VILLSGTQFDFVTGNRIVNNKAWGVVANDYPDTNTQTAGLPDCTGGIKVPALPVVGPVCLYQSQGNVISGNSFAGNGGFGNPGNGDLDNSSTGIATPSGPNANCFQDNTNDSGTVTGEPVTIGLGICPALPGAIGTVELICDSGALIACPAGLPAVTYPQKDGQCTDGAVFQGDSPTTGACMLPLPAQTTMPNPCAGVPSDPWCPGAAVAAASTTGLPLTSASRQAGPVLPLVVIAVAAGATIGWRRRRRPARVS